MVNLKIYNSAHFSFRAGRLLVIREELRKAYNSWHKFNISLRDGQLGRARIGRILFSFPRKISSCTGNFIRADFSRPFFCVIARRYTEFRIRPGQFMATRSRGLATWTPSSSRLLSSLLLSLIRRRRGGEREGKSSAPVGFFGSRKICGARVRDDLDVHLI